jgi:glutaredoxin-like protein
MLRNIEGQRVPFTTFRTRENGQWKDVQGEEFFSGRTVILFALPGAYTPTCSSTHLPRYNELAPVFRSLGVGAIACLSVNDAFVMSEWQKDQDAPNVAFLPDGNAAFTRGMGMLVDKSDLGFGERSWRYSMLVKDGVIQKMFIEPQKQGDPFEVSDADTMLAYLAPGKKAPEPAVIFSKPGCPHCARARKILDDNSVAYEQVELGKGITFSTIRAVSGQGTAPQVFIGGKHIGGADELEAYFQKSARKAA